MNKVKRVATTIGNVLDWTIDQVLALVIPAKEKKIETLTFDDLLRMAKALETECDGTVSAVKCFVCFDSERLFYRCGVFPVDQNMNAFGDKGNPVADFVQANQLDAKISTLLRNGNGNFMIKK